MTVPARASAEAKAIASAVGDVEQKEAATRVKSVGRVHVENEGYSCDSRVRGEGERGGA